MEYKLRDIVEVLDHSELLKMKRDLDRGGVHLQKFIKEKIAQKEHTYEKQCTVCSNGILPESIHTFNVVFGPESFKKKGTFCGMDCLQYFLTQVSEIRRNMSVDAISDKFEDCNDDFETGA